VLKRMAETRRRTHQSVSCILTNPPESIFLYLSSNQNQQNRIEYIIYDSHPRPYLGLKCSHFLIFENEKNILQYLKELYPYVDLGDDSEDLASQLLNMCDATFLQLKENANPSQNPDLEEMKQELTKIGVERNMEFDKKRQI